MFLFFLKAKSYKLKAERGFTLLEVLVVLAIIVVVGAVVLMLINPSARFAKSRNNERAADLNVILNAVSQNIADNKGSFSCSAGYLPSTSTRMAVGLGDYDIVPCLFPTYLVVVPYDPNGEGVFYTSTSSYDSGYDIFQDSVTGRVIIEAPLAELSETISATR